MSRGSLRLRLMLASAISIAAALFLTGLALVQLFERQMRERVQEELGNDLLQLTGAIETGADGVVKVARSLTDPRFQEPYGGRYWRIDFSAPGASPGREPLRSPSLWDADLDPANPVLGPEGERLLSVTQQVTVQSAGKPLPLWLVAAAHEDEINRPLAELRDQLILSFGLIGLILMLGTWVQVTVGLKPLQHLRQQLADIRAGRTQRLVGGVPEEVAPLVEEINDVLSIRETSLERARRRAGDLAHGLKTPLTILAAIAREMRGRKLGKQADDIDEQTEAMHRHIEQALVRARLSTGRGHATTRLRPVAEKVVAALERLPRGEEIDWDIHVPPEALLPLEQGDLTELLGNLLDNARKWAKGRVRLSYAAPYLVIEDDGPGVDEDRVSEIAERGRRLDETTQGSGLGLSIVADIADIYGLSVSYGRSGLGGLKVTIGL
jgi:signal transduction histidine kinase